MLPNRKSMLKLTLKALGSLAKTHLISNHQPSWSLCLSSLLIAPWMNLLHFPPFTPNFSSWVALLPPFYLPRAIPKDWVCSKTFPKPKQVFCGVWWPWFRTMIWTTYWSSSQAHETLPTSCTDVLKSFPFPCLYFVYPTRMQSPWWQVLHLLFMSPTAFSNAISCVFLIQSEHAINVFIDNWVILFSPTMWGIQQPFCTNECSNFFFLVGKLSSHYSASRILAFLKCLVGK